MSLKKGFLITTVIVGSMILLSVRAHAIPICAGGFICFWQDPLGAAAGFVLRKTQKALLNPVYDITDGLEKIKSNIGMYRDKGDCGISATGNSGCDLTTPEQGAQEDAEMDAEAQVIPDSTIKIITESESDGSIVLDGKSDQKGKKDDVVGNKGDTFDRVRENVASYVFVSDNPDVNADCKCSRGTGADCEPTECAQSRQNEALMQSSLGASSTADFYLKDMDANYDNLVKLVEEVNGAETLADFVGEMGRLSVYASSAVTDIMTLQTHDLRSQSYRNLIFGTTNPVDLSKLKKEQTK